MALDADAAGAGRPYRRLRQMAMIWTRRETDDRAVRRRPCALRRPQLRPRRRGAARRRTPQRPSLGRARGQPPRVPDVTWRWTSRRRAVVERSATAASAATAGTSRYADEKTATTQISARSEERRVGKECRSRWSPY